MQVHRGSKISKLATDTRFTAIWLDSVDNDTELEKNFHLCFADIWNEFKQIINARTSTRLWHILLKWSEKT